MFIIPTKPIRTTTETPKAPRDVSSMGKSELEALATRMGWTPRELTYQEITKDMSSAEARYHEICNTENWGRAFRKEEARHKNADVDAQWDRRKKWTGKKAVSEEERARMREVASEFEQLYPQYVKSEANSNVLWTYLRENNLDPTKLQDIVSAFSALAQSGQIALNPSAISAGPETSVEGRDLLSHHNIHLLLQPQRRVNPEDKLSAKQYLEQHPELHDKRTPPLIQQRIAREQNTAEHFQKTQEATATHNGTRFTDYSKT